MARLCVRLLGSFHVTLDDQPVTRFATDKARALLAYLAVEAERPHRREALAGLLWPDYPEPSARTSLRSSLLALRQVIGDRDADPPFLHISRQTIQFNCKSDAWVDARAFAALLECADQEVADAQGTRALEEAVALYRGEFLDGFSVAESASFEEWAVLTREQLRRLVVEALDQLVQRYEAAGEYEIALPHSWRQVELDPWRERGQRQLMHLLATSGQRAAALSQYEACRELLEEELGVEPAAETTALYEHILAEEIHPPADNAGLPLHNLPQQPTPFVGREAMLAEIGERLDDPACRLLTLVGPGGSGKTRLALEAAAAQLERYPHGVYLISLAPLSSAASIVPTVADSLGFTFYTGRESQEQLLDYLRGKTMLLVMDNYEHLLSPPLSSSEGVVRPSKPSENEMTQGGATLVTEILRTAPGVKILTTSRTRLNVGGEHRFPITGMQYPDLETLTQAREDARQSARCAQDHARRRAVQMAAQYSAVKLFVQVARRSEPRFELTEDNLSGVIQICQLVNGMPLAIRLAAPWVTMLSPDEIGSELARSLDLLATDRQDVPARQRSVRATLDHTWRLLGEPERVLMQALSIFRGGFTREAAQQVAGASPRQLMGLIDRSLLHPTHPGRQEIHELLRQYAGEKLDRTPDGGAAAQNRHCGFFATALEHWATDLKGARQQVTMAEIQVDQGNARAAWDWAVEQGQVARLDQAVEGLCLFYNRRGRLQEGEAACRIAADKLAAMAPSNGSVAPQSVAERSPAEVLRVLAKILTWQGRFNWSLGRLEPARQLVQHSFTLLESPELVDKDTQAERAEALCFLGGIAFYLGNWEERKRLDEESLALYRALGDDWGVALMLGSIAELARFSGAFDEAKRLAEESLTLRRVLGDQWGVANALLILSANAQELGQLEEAERLARESIRVYERSGYRGQELGPSIWRLARILVQGGKFAQGHAQAQKTLWLAEELGVRWLVAWSNIPLGDAKLHLGQYEEAHALAQLALTQSRESGEPMSALWSLYGLGVAALAVEAYDEAQQNLRESVGIIRETGRQLVLGQALAGLGLAARGLGELTRAQRHLREALRTGVEIKHVWTLVEALPAAALIMADRGDAEWAVQIYALASRYPYVANSRFYEDLAGKHIAAVAAALPAEVVAAAQERGRARDLWTTAQELLEELGE